MPGESLLNIVNDILDFSKIESNKMEIISESYNLNTIVYNLMALLSRRAEEKNLTLEFEVQDCIPTQLIGDEMRIQQIILNLLTNGIKYTPEGSVTCKISYEKVDESNIILIASVIDSGIGISEEN